MILAVCLLLATAAAFFVFGRNWGPQGLASRFDISFALFQKLLAAWFAIASLLVIFFAFKALQAKSDVTHPESSVVYSAENSAKSGKLYSDLNASPYTPTPYGPFFYSTLQLIGHLVGSEADDIRHGYRLFNFCCFLLLPVLAFSIIFRVSGSSASAMLGAAASISAFFFHMWDITARPDIAALLLSLLAIWFLCSKQEPRPGDLVFAALACSSAVLFKQSFVAVPLSILMTLIIHREAKRLLIFVGASCASGLLAMSYYVVKGEPYLRQVLLIGKSPIDFRSSIYLASFYLPTGVGFVVLLLGCAGFWLAISSPAWRLNLLGYYFFFSTVIGLLTILQVGGNCNYFFEMWIASSLLLPLAFSRLQGTWNSADAGFKLGACVMLLALLLQQVYSQRQIAKLVQNYDVQPLKELKVLSTLPYLTMHGRDPQFLDPFLLTIAEEHGVWSPAPLINEIAGQKFDVVFLMQEGHHLYKYRGFDLFSPAVVASLKANYVPMCRTGGLIVLRPSSRTIGFGIADAGRVLNEQCFADGDTDF